MNSISNPAEKLNGRIRRVYFLTLIVPGYFQNNLSWGGAQLSSPLKSAVSAILLHTKQQKTFKGTLGTLNLTPI